MYNFINKQKESSKTFSVQCRDNVPAKRKESRDVSLLCLHALPAKSTSISFVLFIQIVACVHEE